MNYESSVSVPVHQGTIYIRNLDFIHQPKSDFKSIQNASVSE